MMDKEDEYELLQIILSENGNTSISDDEFDSCVKAILNIYKKEEIEHPFIKIFFMFVGEFLSIILLLLELRLSKSTIKKTQHNLTIKSVLRIIGLIFMFIQTKFVFLLLCGTAIADRTGRKPHHATLKLSLYSLIKPAIKDIIQQLFTNFA